MATLQTHTVDSTTLNLLNELMYFPELSEFALVGGTNLSLRYGHRVSVDLDLFTNEPFDRDEILKSIQKAFPKVVLLGGKKQSLFLTINGVKVDIILHEYPYLKGIEEIAGIRFLSVEDVIPMKLEAMATRGVKKDFWDISELLNHYSLYQMLEFYQERYKNNDVGHVLLSMTYFEDAELQKDDPQDVKGITWEQVKAKMEKTVADYVRRQV